MSRLFAVLVGLLASVMAAANGGARFDSRTSILELPEVTVDQTTVIHDLQLQLLPGRPWSLFSVGTTRAGTPYPLTTQIVDFPGYLTKDTVFRLANGDLWSGCAAFTANAPLAEKTPTVTIYRTAADEYRLQFANSAVACMPQPLNQISGSASAAAFSVQPPALVGRPGEILQFIVGGGVPPYTAVAANPAILLVRTPSFSGVSGSAQLTAQTGETALLLSDAAGHLLMVPVTNSAPATPPSVPLTITPDLLEASRGDRLVFAIAGGLPPYLVASTNTALLAVRSISADAQMPRATVTVEALASSGNARLVAVDASGATVSATIRIAATGGPASPTALTLTPQAIEARQGEQLTLAISGGVAPYQVTSSQPGLVAVRAVQQDALAGRASVTLDVLGVTGSAQITVIDAQGQVVGVPVSIVAAGPVSAEPLSLSPASLIGHPGEQLVVGIAGGVAPYRITLSHPSLMSIAGLEVDATSARASVTLRLAEAVGEGTITVLAANGAAISAPVRIVPGPVSAQALSVRPASITAAFGSATSFAIAGGAAPYTVASSNNAVVVVRRVEQNSQAASAVVGLYISGRGSAYITVTDAAGHSAEVLVVGE